MLIFLLLLNDAPEHMPLRPVALTSFCPESFQWDWHGCPATCASKLPAAVNGWTLSGHKAHSFTRNCFSLFNPSLLSCVDISCMRLFSLAPTSGQIPCCCGDRRCRVSCIRPVDSKAPKHATHRACSRLDCRPTRQWGILARTRRTVPLTPPLLLRLGVGFVQLEVSAEIGQMCQLQMPPRCHSTSATDGKAAQRISSAKNTSSV